MPLTTIMIIGAAASVIALVALASAVEVSTHMGVSALSAIVLALLGVAQVRKSFASAENKSAVAGVTARTFGIVWLWGAVAILTTYAFGFVEYWPEWWHFTLGFGVAAALSFGFASMAAKDAAIGKEDETILSAGRVLAIVQLIGMVAGIVSIFVDGKFPREVRYHDWAGMHVVFFGAFAIALLSANAVLTSRKS